MTGTGEASAPVLLDILADLTPRTGDRGTCQIGQLRAARPDLAEQYDKAVAAGRFGDRAIADWITRHGHPLNINSVARHRRGECQQCRPSWNG